MFEIFVEESFSAAHNLRDYKGKCENLHGHNYKVKVFAEGETLGKDGMLVDFTVLKEILKEILSVIDHRNLNEIEPFDKINPTAENIAKNIYEQFKRKMHDAKYTIRKVSVWETDRNCATYYEK